jgi:hypothetical protein
MNLFQRTGVLSAALAAACAGSAYGQAFPQHFDDITTLVPGGWFMQNNSAPLGTTNWFQGNPGIFAAQTGAASAYIAANFNNASGSGTISNWLLTPAVSVHDGDQLTFWTRTTSSPAFADRLEVRLSIAGASTNVGTLPTDVGDFGIVLLTVNPDLTLTGYPTAWTQLTATVSGAGASATGRLAFRYFVTSGGPSGSNSNYIGIDEVAFGAGVATGACCTNSVCAAGVTQAACTGGGGTYLGDGSTCAAGCGGGATGACCTGGACAAGVTQAACVGGGGTYLGDGSTCAAGCGGGGSCYANCDNSTAVPFLNVQDFSCFLTKFASNDPYANCDSSTAIPTLNVQDFSCYLTKFATGCSAP